MTGSKFHEEAIRRLSEKICEQKNKLILQRLKKLNIEIDIKEESKRLFPRIALKIDRLRNTETYYYNDGSKEGLRIITFEAVLEPIKYQDMKCTISYNYKSY